MKALLAAVILFTMAGCPSRRAIPDAPGVAAGGVPTPGAGGSILGAVASWAGGVASYAVIAGIVLVAVGRGAMRKAGGDILIAAGAVLLCVPILQWVDRNMWWIAAAVAVLGLAVGLMWCWHRIVPKIETLIGFDLNRNGVIGPKEAHNGR